MENTKETKTQEEIHNKGFNMNRTYETEYGKMKIGAKTVEDAVIDLASTFNSINKNYTNKSVILKAIYDKDYSTMREVSDVYYHTDGIYKRICNYFATLFRYDWYCMPEVYDKKIKKDKIESDFTQILSYLDHSSIKKICGDIALSVVVKGVYYGYLTDSKENISFQELPAEYCRSRFSIGNVPAIEFNMKFFDDKFPDTGYRLRILKMFPAEFAKGYQLYKSGKLLADNMKSTTS